MRDEIIQRLIDKTNDIARQLHDLQRLDVAPLPTGLASYSGTPVAGQLAQWTGAGTIGNSGYAGSAVVRYSGVPTAGAISYWTGDGTAAAATFGTGDIARYTGTPVAGNVSYWTAAGTVADSGIGTASIARLNGTVAFSAAQTFDDAVTISGNVTLGGNIAGLRVASGGNLTISGGVVTKTGTFHAVDTQGGAGSDDLDTINGGSTGDLLILRIVASGRSVTIKNNTGNIRCGTDRTLNTNQDLWLAMYNAGVWCELVFSNNS